MKISPPNLTNNLLQTDTTDSDFSLSSATNNMIYDSLQTEKLFQEKLAKLSKLNDMDSYIQMQSELGSITVKMNFSSTVIRKGLNVLETLFKAQ